MVQGQNVADDLRRLIDEGRTSLQTLHVVTRIPAETITAFLEDKSSGSTELTAQEPALSPDEIQRVSVLAAQLTYGFEIDDDERLRSILEALTAECGFTLHHISRLTGIPVDDLTLALDDPGALPSETRYRIAMRAAYLINAANQAQPR
mgnify:CR=1 FL=1